MLDNGIRLHLMNRNEIRQQDGDIRMSLHIIDSVAYRIIYQFIIRIRPDKVISGKDLQSGIYRSWQTFVLLFDVDKFSTALVYLWLVTQYFVFRMICTAVIDHNQFDICMRIGQNTLKKNIQVFFRVIARNDYADFGRNLFHCSEIRLIRQRYSFVL